MTFSTFILSLTVLLVIFLNREKITAYINENFYKDEEKSKDKFQSEWIVYVLAILLGAVVTMGMLMDNTKEKYGDISSNYQNLKPQPLEEKDQPHRWFDINFDVFNFGKDGDN